MNDICICIWVFSIWFVFVRFFSVGCICICTFHYTIGNKNNLWFCDNRMWCDVMWYEFEVSWHGIGIVWWSFLQLWKTNCLCFCYCYFGPTIIAYLPNKLLHLHVSDYLTIHGWVVEPFSFSFYLGLCRVVSWIPFFVLCLCLCLLVIVLMVGVVIVWIFGCTVLYKTCWSWWIRLCVYVYVYMLACWLCSFAVQLTQTSAIVRRSDLYLYLSLVYWIAYGTIHRIICCDIGGGGDTRANERGGTTWHGMAWHGMVDSSRHAMMWQQLFCLLCFFVIFFGVPLLMTETNKRYLFHTRRYQ